MEAVLRTAQHGHDESQRGREEGSDPSLQRGMLAHELSSSSCASIPPAALGSSYPPMAASMVMLPSAEAANRLRSTSSVKQLKNGTFAVQPTAQGVAPAPPPGDLGAGQLVYLTTKPPAPASRRGRSPTAARGNRPPSRGAQPPSMMMMHRGASSCAGPFMLTTPMVIPPETHRSAPNLPDGRAAPNPLTLWPPVVDDHAVGEPSPPEKEGTSTTELVLAPQRRTSKSKRRSRSRQRKAPTHTMSEALGV